MVGTLFPRAGTGTCGKLWAVAATDVIADRYDRKALLREISADPGLAEALFIIRIRPPEPEAPPSWPRWPRPRPGCRR